MVKLEKFTVDIRLKLNIIIMNPIEVYRGQVHRGITPPIDMVMLFQLYQTLILLVLVHEIAWHTTSMIDIIKFLVRTHDLQIMTVLSMSLRCLL